MMIEKLTEYLASGLMEYQVNPMDMAVMVPVPYEDRKLPVVFVFNEPEEEGAGDVAVFIMDLVVFPPEKRAEMTFVSNRLNMEDRWCKFYVESSEPSVTLMTGGIVTEETCVDVCMTLFTAVVNGAKTAIPLYLSALKDEGGEQRVQ